MVILVLNQLMGRWLETATEGGFDLADGVPV
jgi:hypothetical protein